MATDDKKEQKPKKGGGGKIIFVMMLIGCLVPFGVPTLLVMGGMLPTLVVLFTETDSRHSALATVGYMNLAGVLPFVIELWQKGQTMQTALLIVRDPTSWIVMFGAAAIGHLILYAVPSAVATGIVSKKQARLRKLQDGLKELEAVWGTEIGTDLPIEAIRSQKGAE